MNPRAYPWTPFIVAYAREPFFFFVLSRGRRYPKPVDLPGTSIHYAELLILKLPQTLWNSRAHGQGRRIILGDSRASLPFDVGYQPQGTDRDSPTTFRPYRQTVTGGTGTQFPGNYAHTQREGGVITRRTRDAVSSRSVGQSSFCEKLRQVVTS